MSRIDVFVPCYRYARFLRQSVRSILNQSLVSLRVLIINDASPDETAEIAAELAAQDARVEVLNHDVNHGHIATYNEGIEWATADYMLLLSADDILMPGALERAVMLMDAHSDVGLTYGRVIYFQDGLPIKSIYDPNCPVWDSPFQATGVIVDSEPHSLSPRARTIGLMRRHRSRPAGSLAGDWRILSGSEFMRSNRHSNQVHTATAIVRTSLQKQIGGYLQELPHAGDLEMWFRFAAHAPVGYINAYQGAARIHDDSMSQHFYENAIFDLRQRQILIDRLFERYGNLIPDSTGLSKDMHRGLAEAAVRAAGVPFSKGDQKSCSEILELAAEIDPRIRSSLLWYLFGWKQRFGPRISSVIAPAVRSIVIRTLSV